MVNEIPTKRAIIRVMLADDHKIVRAGLVNLLREERGIEVVGEASDGEMAVELVQQCRPDVVIMDVNMPRMNGVDATRCIKDRFPEVRIVGMSMHEKKELASVMCRAGAAAYVAKDCPFEELVEAIRGT